MKSILTILVCIFTLAPQIGWSACERSSLDDETAELVRSEIQGAYAISQTPLLPQHSVLWPLIEVYAAGRSAPHSTMALWSLAIPIIGPLISAGHSLNAIGANTNARQEGYRAVSIDAGIQALNLTAFRLGQQYQGHVPEAVVSQIAKAFDNMASGIDGWPRGLASRYLRVKGTSRPDGFEFQRVLANQFERNSQNPIRFGIEEVEHLNYTFLDAIVHTFKHRLAGTRALLMGRPLDAITLQATQDMDVDVLGSDGYH